MASPMKFLRLARTEKVLLCKSLALVSVIRLSLWLLPARYLPGLLDHLFKYQKDKTVPDWHKIMEIANSVRRVSRIVPGATCLTQAIAASFLIRSSGEWSELKIGVAKGENSTLVAHAWLEKNGRIILGELPDQGRFVELRPTSVNE